jgi:hypothetical protein
MSDAEAFVIAAVVAWGPSLAALAAVALLWLLQRIRRVD